VNGVSAAFAAAGWRRVMVFIRNGNGSHCPEEGMDIDDLTIVVEAVYCALRAEGDQRP
jgi:N-carbamoyl-L-amino-acid hydrolase